MGGNRSIAGDIGRIGLRRPRIGVALALVAALVTATVVAPAGLPGPWRADAAVATATAPDCNHNGTPDVSEVLWANRDDDGDGLCNGVDTCPYEVNPDNSPAACQMQAITVPAEPADPSAPHVTYSGAQITLKGIARYGGTQYRWDFGDGATPTGWSPISSFFDLSIKHVYTGNAGQSFTATLSVGAGALGSPTSVATASYPVLIAKGGSPVLTDPSWVDLRAQMAVDDALWYLHRQEARSQYGDGPNGYAQPFGYWSGGSYLVDDTCVITDAFEQHGSLPERGYDTDPYVDDVRRSMNYILDNSAVTSIAAQQAGNPDTNGNGLGIALGGSLDPNGIGAAGTCLAMLSDSGAPTRLAPAGPSHVYGRSFADIAQDAVDWFAWAQNDSGAARGDWGFTANDNYAFVDAGYLAFPTLALGDAQAEMTSTVPAFVRTELPYWLAYTRNIANGNDNGSWGDNSSTVNVSAANAGAGMLAEEFVGKTSTNVEVEAASGYLYRHWLDNNGSAAGCWGANLGNSSAMYPIALGFSGASLTRITEWNYATNQQTANSFDWYYTPSGQPQTGYAQYLIARQSADGSFPDTSGCSQTLIGLMTAYATMILDHTTPAILKRAPTISWATPSDISYGTALDQTQLDAALSAAYGTHTPPHPGSFTYTPPAATVLPAGDHTLSVTWTPDPLDAAGWNSVTATVTLHVAPATPSAIVVSVPSAGTYGGSTVLSATGGGASTPVTFSVDASSGAGVCSLGADGVTVSYTAVGNCIVDANQPGDSNYLAANQVQATIPIGKAALTATVQPSTRLYGQPDPAFTLAYTGLTNGDTAAAITAKLRPVFTAKMRDGTVSSLTSPVGTYTVRATGRTKAVANYAITFVAGKMTVTNDPHVTAVAPATGPTTGGTRITITGTQFTTGDTVVIGQYVGTTTPVAATDVVIVSPTEITATTGGNAKAGTFTVFVVTNTGSRSPASDKVSFTYTRPTG